MIGRWKWPLFAVASLVLALGTIAPGTMTPSAQAQAGTIKIVSSLPRSTHSDTRYDIASVENAMRMALEEVGYRVGDLAIQYEALDDSTPSTGASEPHHELRNARRSVSDPSIVAYIGPFGAGVARVSIPVLNRGNLVTISPTAAYPGLTQALDPLPSDEPGKYYPTGVRTFARTIPTDDREGAIGATWAAQLGTSRVYVLNNGRPRGKLMSDAFIATAHTLGLDVVGGPESIDPEAPSYRPLAAKVRASGADLVYLAVNTQNNAAQLVTDLRDVLGPDVKLMASDGVYNQAFLDEADSAAEGMYVTFNGVPARKLTGLGAEWYQAYLAHYGAEPSVYAAYGYQAMRLALGAIARAGTADREAIRAAVFATQDENMVLGNCSIDPNGDVTCAVMSGRQVVDGQFDEDNAVVLTTGGT
ncbi:MAG: branched-chain amino acid ABC transporter substrate-binding protein [Chloroflexi bacterium]|nr:branched-chain amino acid ABC transporter substrate-binding protein [Chloroflexota bacterium]